jgi:hypothetical protein
VGIVEGNADKGFEIRIRGSVVAVPRMEKDGKGRYLGSLGRIGSFFWIGMDIGDVQGRQFGQSQAT